MCFSENELLGNHQQFVEWAEEQFNYEDFRPELLHAAVAEEAYKDHFLNSKVRTLFDGGIFTAVYIS